MFTSKLPLALLLAVALPAVAAARPPQEEDAPDTGFRFDAFLAASPDAAFDYLESNGCVGRTEGGIVDIGAGGAASYRLARAFELGLGLRYDLGLGRRDDAHFVSLPVLATLIVPVGSGREFQLVVGAGLVAGSIAGYAADSPGTPSYCSSSFMLGPSVELGAGYIQPLSRDIALLLQAGVRLEAMNPTLGIDFIHVQTPFVRLGVRFK